MFILVWLQQRKRSFFSVTSENKKNSDRTKKLNHAEKRDNEIKTAKKNAQKVGTERRRNIDSPYGVSFSGMPMQNMN